MPAPLVSTKKQLINTVSSARSGSTANDHSYAFLRRKTMYLLRLKISAEAMAVSTGLTNQLRTMGTTPLTGGKLCGSGRDHLTLSGPP